MSKHYKSPEELEEERQELAKYALNSFVLDRTRLLLIYCRQSTDKQYFKSAKDNTEQRSELEEHARMLQWPVENIMPPFVENDVSKRGKASGRISIDDRPKIKEVRDIINSGQASALLVIDVGRLSRDEDLIDHAVLAKECKRNRCVIITVDPTHVYDFNNPNGNEQEAFVKEGMKHSAYIKEHIKGKMLKARTKIATNGKVANGIAPIGLKCVDSELVPTSHAPIVNRLHHRFKELEASRTAMLAEIAAMARRGKPLFPIADDVDPKSVFLTEVHNADGKLIGWTIKSRYGLNHVLGNPSYQGHLVFNDRVIKRDAFPQACIVDADVWQYAYDCTAETDLDGHEIERPNQAVRFYQHNAVPNVALLAGTRYDGRAVVESVNGASVYVALGEKPVYRIRRSEQEFIASILVSEIDSIVENKLLELVNLVRIDNMRMWEDSDGYTHIEVDASPFMAQVLVSAQEKPAQPKPDDTLEVINSEIASLQRKLDIASDVMDAEELKKNYAKLARLKARRADVEQSSKRAESQAQEQEATKQDIVHAREQYRSWDLEHKRRFIRTVTDAITLEEIGSGWIRLSIFWSELVGACTERCYIWKESSGKWSDAEMETLKRLYPSAPVSTMLAALPTRSHAAIQTRATLSKIKRTGLRNDSTIDRYMSLSDVAVIQEYCIKPGMRVQWVSCSVGNDDEERNRKKIHRTFTELRCI